MDEEKRCNYCDLEEIENNIHFIIHCTFYHDIYTLVLISGTHQIYPGNMWLSDEEKLKCFLYFVYFCSLKFFDKAWNKRKRATYNYILKVFSSYIAKCTYVYRLSVGLSHSLLSDLSDLTLEYSLCARSGWNTFCLIFLYLCIIFYRSRVIIIIIAWKTLSTYYVLIYFSLFMRCSLRRTPEELSLWIIVMLVYVSINPVRDGLPTDDLTWTCHSFIPYTVMLSNILEFHYYNWSIRLTNVICWLVSGCHHVPEDRGENLPCLWPWSCTACTYTGESGWPRSYSGNEKQTKTVIELVKRFFKKGNVFIAGP